MLRFVSHVVLLMRIVVKCRESAIAQIVTLLSDKNEGDWRAGADALSKLSEQGK